MSNSSLISYVKISPNRTSPRNHVIDTVTIHCVVGQCSIETLGDIFSPTSKQASSNYGIGPDGRIGMYVEESDRSWCSSNAANDNRAITIEVASDTYHPYKVTDKAYKALIELLADICKRNNIKQLLWKADKSLIGQVDKQNMTVHRWFANKSCPGDYLYNLHEQIAKEVNAKLGVVKIDESTPSSSNDSIISYDNISIGDTLEFKGDSQYTSADSNSQKSAKPCKVKVTQKYIASSKHPIHVRAIDDKGHYIIGIYGWVDIKDLYPVSMKPYQVNVTADGLNYRSGPSTSYRILGTITDKGVYTIVQEKDGWGQLQSRLGWISLKYTTRI